MTNTELLIREKAKKQKSADQGRDQNGQELYSGPGIWTEDKLRQFTEKHNIKILGRHNGKLEGQTVNYFNVNCPWEDLHSSKGKASETTIFLRNGFFCFDCKHAHCQDKKGKDFISFYEPNFYREQARAKAKDQEEEISLPKIVCVADIEEKEPEWLIQDFIPRYQITTLASDGGIGKTSIACKLISCITNGIPFWTEDEDLQRAPENVLFLSGEDSFTYTLKKRLRKENADMRRIFCVEISDDNFKSITLKSRELEEIIKQVRPGLIIMDPWQSFLDEDVKIAERNHVRRCLEKLIAYGEKYGATTLLIAHTNKRSGAYGRERIADSSDLWDASRSVLMMGRTKNDNEKYLSCEKHNYTMDPGSILFTITGAGVDYVGRSDKHDIDYISVRNESAGRPSKEKEEAKSYIMQSIAECKIPIGDLKKSAKENGISEKTFRNAKEELIKEGKCKIEKEASGKNAGVKWYISMALADINPEEDP